MAGRVVWRARMVRGLLVLALAAGCSAGGSAAVGPTGPQPRGPARSVFGPRYLSSLGPVAVISAGDAWVAGSVAAGETTLMEHWDGAGWSRVRDPAFAGWAINGLAAVSARDIWAVGYVRHPTEKDPSRVKLLIAHFDGTAWQRAQAPRLPGDTTLGAVTVVSARDAWAVGSWGIRRTTRPLILHWDGSAWTRVAAHGPPGAGLAGVAALSARDAWAVGTSIGVRTNSGRTLTEHWDGSAWRPVPSPDPSRVDDQLNAVAVVSPRDAWAVGGVVNRVGRVRTLVLHWDGTAWQIVPSPRRPGGRLLSIAARSGRDIWAAGYSFGPNCLILHWDGTAWTPSPTPKPPDCALHAVAAVTGGAWAIGTWARPPKYRQHGLIQVWNGKTWT